MKKFIAIVLGINTALLSLIEYFDYWDKHKNEITMAFNSSDFIPPLLRVIGSTATLALFAWLLVKGMQKMKNEITEHVQKEIKNTSHDTLTFVLRKNRENKENLFDINSKLIYAMMEYLKTGNDRERDLYHSMASFLNEQQLDNYFVTEEDRTFAKQKAELRKKHNL